ncbi:MAG: CapA family protein [Anaerovoracaceae bacterium]
MRSDNKKLSKIKVLIAVLLIIAIILAGIFVAIIYYQNLSKENEIARKIEAKKKELKTEEVELSVLLAGDIMLHTPNLASGLDKSTGKYNFKDNYKYVKEMVSKADVAICNIESPIPGKPYDGYPMFRAPDALATAIKSAGFDVTMTASNHTLDAGEDGMERTIKVIEKNAMQAAGSREKAEEPRYTMVKTEKGNVAVVAYMYETGGANDGSISLNGNPISDTAAERVNTFNYDSLNEDVKEVSKVTAEAREAGADVILVYYHWGEEYQMQPNSYQKKLAQMTVDTADADLIFGSHPHVPQGSSMLTNKETGRKVPVYYALGNYMSNQRDGLEGLSWESEEGYMVEAKFNIKRSIKENKLISSELISQTDKYIPYWTDKYFKGGRDVYYVIPLVGDWKANKALKESGHTTSARRALKSVKSLFE